MLLLPSRAHWKLSPKYQGVPSDSPHTNGYYTLRRWFALLRRTGDAAESWKDVRCPFPFPRKKIRPLRCWEVRLLRESQAAQRYTRVALCLEPVQALVAPVRPPCRVARSRQKAMCLPANLTTLPKYLQSWLEFWMNPGAHNHWRTSSKWIWVGNNGDEVHRGLRRRIRRGRTPATGRPRPDAAHCTHPPRIPRNYHCGARDEGTR